jgi:hypothetical protein
LKITSAYHKLPWLEIILSVVVISVNIYAARSDPHNLPNKWFTRDDAYYYFKVAQNISEGLGSTFDGINPTNGYHPLWLLVCIPIFSLARFDLVLPLRILLVLLAVIRISTSILLYRILKNCIAQPIAVAAAIFWAFDYTIHLTVYQQGLETGLAALTLVLFLYVLQKVEKTSNQRPLSNTQLVILGICALLFVFSRLDLIFLAGIFGVWIAFRDKSARYLLIVDLLIFTISLSGALIIRVGLPEFYQYRNLVLVALALSLTIKFPTFYMLGLYDRLKIRSFLNLILRNLLAIVVSSVLIFGTLIYFLRVGLVQGNFPRSVPAIDAIIALFLTMVFRILAMNWRPESTITGHPTVNSGGRIKLENWLRYSLVYYGILGCGIGLYMVWNKLTFGTSTPISGQVKRWWGSFASKVYGGSARTPLSFYGLDSQGDFNAWSPFTNFVGEWHRQIDTRYLPFKYDLGYFLLLFAISVSLVLILFYMNRARMVNLTKKLALVPLLVGAEFQILSYNLTGYSALKEWYWVSQLVWLLLAASVAVDVLTKPFRKYRLGYITLAVLTLYWGFSVATSSSRITIHQMQNTTSSSEKPLMESAAFIEKYTKPGSLIGMTGGGNVGYFIQDRTIINMDGLINSYPYFIANKAQKGNEYLENIGMNYIFANPDFLARQPYRGQYSEQLEVIDYYGGKAIMHFLPEPTP